LELLKALTGNQWFAESIGNKISKISPQTGQITKYNIPTANAWPTGITADFCGISGSWKFRKQIGKICSLQALLPSIYSEYLWEHHYFGPDGNLWSLLYTISVNFPLNQTQLPRIVFLIPALIPVMDLSILLPGLMETCGSLSRINRQNISTNRSNYRIQYSHCQRWPQRDY